MSQRTVAGLVALPLLLGLWLAAVLLPVPYVTYQPGLTLDVLGKEDGEEIIQVRGGKTFRDEGQLRMTTVYVTQPGGRVTLVQALEAWLSPEQAVYPYEAVYRQDETAETADEESSVQMDSSQDAAVAVALTELGYDVHQPVVAAVEADAPADGVLEAGDVLLEIGGREVDTAEDVVTGVQEATAGEPIPVVVERDGEETRVEVAPERVDGEPRIGIQVGAEFDFPFEVDIEVVDIGGPSAGLMFSLGVYDTLTPGSLTDGEVVAGTGSLDPDGNVGPVGGIAQKVVGARDADAALFLVPADNCEAALGGPRGAVQLVSVETMHQARTAIETWAEDRDADLRTCQDTVAASAAARSTR